MKQLLTGMLIMFLMTCYLMGNVGHFPLPQYLLLPDKIVTEHPKDWYLWLNITVWTLSYIGIYWCIYHMMKRGEAQQITMKKWHAISITVVFMLILAASNIILADYYTRYKYTVPVTVEWVVGTIASFMGGLEARKNRPAIEEYFDQMKKIRKAAKH